MMLNGLSRPSSIHVLMNTLEPVGLIDQYKTLNITQKFYEIGSFDLTVPAAPYRFIAIDHLIDFGQSGEVVGIVEGITRTVSSAGDELRVYGPLLGGLLKRRVIVPNDDPSLYGWDVANGTAGAIMAHYVNSHVVSPTITARAIPNVTIMNGIANVGMETVAKARFDVLSDIISEVAMYAGIGWRIIIAGGNLEFQALEPRDRRSSSDSPLILSPSAENISTIMASTDATSYANAVYALGDGEYENRLWQVYYSGDETRSGWERSEIAVDCGNESDISRLRDVSLQKIADLEQTESIKGALIPGASDAALGDFCTYLFPALGVSYDLVISEIMTAWSGANTRIDITLGKPPRTFTSAFHRSERLKNVT